MKVFDTVLNTFANRLAITISLFHLAILHIDLPSKFPFVITLSEVDVNEHYFKTDYLRLLVLRGPIQMHQFGSLSYFYWVYHPLSSCFSLNAWPLKHVRLQHCCLDPSFRIQIRSITGPTRLVYAQFESQLL